MSEKEVFIGTPTDNQYRQLVMDVLQTGQVRKDRTGVGTVGIFGYQMRFSNLAEYFPILTSKFVSLKSVAAELQWFLSGSRNNNDLLARGVTIWNEWDVQEMTPAQLRQAYPEEFARWKKDAGFREWLQGTGHKTTTGDLGPVYGDMWRSWPDGNGGHIDQIKELLDGLINKPYSRRHIVTGWNPAVLPNEKASHRENISNNKQVLPPCHLLIQFHVEDITSVDGTPLTHPDGRPERRLNCQLYQRSADVALGVPYNIASYALMTLLFAQFCGYEAGSFIHTFGDAHIYLNHREKLHQQVLNTQAYLGFGVEHFPKVTINPEITNLESFLNWPSDKPFYTLENYRHNGKYSYDVAV